MSIRVLVIEDMDMLYTILLRDLSKTPLPMDRFEFVRAKTPALAVEALKEDWDVILMDYHLGSIGAVEEDGIRIHNGEDLIVYRRKLEVDLQKKKAVIIGTSGSDFCWKMEAVGATFSCPGPRRDVECIKYHLNTLLFIV